MSQLDSQDPGSHTGSMATTSASKRRTKDWAVEITEAPGSGLKNFRDSYESYDTAIRQLRTAARSRETRRPGSAIRIYSKVTGQVIWTWHGPETDVAKAVTGGAASVCWELKYEEIA